MEVPLSWGDCSRCHPERIIAVYPYRNSSMTVVCPTVQSELEFVRWLQQRVPPHQRCDLQLGDDCAIVRVEHSTVVTTDMLVEGGHFLSKEVGPRRIGRKLLAVNLSDLAAMAARPAAAVISLALPRDDGYRLAIELYEGLLPLAQCHDVAIAGGDTNVWDGPLVVSLTLLGDPHPRGSLRRDTAVAGDVILVTGTLGGSLQGRHFDFEPRVDEAIRLRGDYDLHAGIDITDGLAIDLSRILSASRCGAIVDVDSVPISEAAQELARRADDELSPLQHALLDGEDFELLLTTSQDEAQRIVADAPLDIPITIIGEITPDGGMRQRDRQGHIAPLPADGYQHRTAP